MITLVDGPAAGKVLPLKRAPLYLRVVIAPDGTVDALDMLDDEAKATETLHVYRQATTPQWVHLNMGSARRGSGFYPMADYRHLPDVDGELVRSTEAWRDWVLALAEAPV